MAALQSTGALSAALLAWQATGAGCYVARFGLLKGLLKDLKGLLKEHIFPLEYPRGQTYHLGVQAACGSTQHTGAKKARPSPPTTRVSGQEASLKTQPA